MSNKLPLSQFVKILNSRNLEYPETLVFLNGKQKYDHNTTDTTKVLFRCINKHEWFATPHDIIEEGKSCPTCYRNVRHNFEQGRLYRFINKANKVHHFKYDYSKVESRRGNYYKPVLITCPIHGDFGERPDRHHEGYGCPRCVRGTAVSICEEIGTIYEFGGNCFC